MANEEVEAAVTETWFPDAMWLPEKNAISKIYKLVQPDLIPVCTNWQAHLALEEKVKSEGWYLRECFDHGDCKNLKLSKKGEVSIWAEGATYLETYAKAALKINPPAGRR